MLYKNVKNINSVNKSNKKILSKECFDSERIDVKLKKYDSQLSKNRIKQEAQRIYEQLLNNRDNNDNNNSFKVPSVITGVYYYTIVFDNLITLKDGRKFYESDTFLEYEYIYNPYFCSKLVKELDALARKDDLYLEYSLREDKLAESYFMNISVMTREQFEDMYDISLDLYYDSQDIRITRGNNSRETKFRKEIAKLKKSYIRHMIDDINNGFEKSITERDGYFCYLKIACEFDEIKNKEEILEEFGLEFDESNKNLLLKKEKELTLEL